MKALISTLFALSTIPSFASEVAEKIAYVLKDPSVAQAIEAAVSDAQPNASKAWFKGIVVSETPVSCKGDRQTFVLLYGRTVKNGDKDETQKCSQLVRFGDCNTVTGKIAEVEKAPRCKSAK